MFLIYLLRAAQLYVPFAIRNSQFATRALAWHLAPPPSHPFLKCFTLSQARDPLGSIDDVDYFVMVNTSSMMLRGLGEMLQQYRNLAVSWGPMARKALQAEGKLKAVEAEIAAWRK